MPIVIEIMTFRLRDQSDVDAFLAIDARVQTEVAYQCPGLLRRTIARDGDRWLVLQIWASPEACERGAGSLTSSTLAELFMAFVDPSTVSVDRFGDAALPTSDASLLDEHQRVVLRIRDRCDRRAPGYVEG